MRGCDIVLSVLGLAPQLSAAVVAFTIEADSEFEQRVQHVTTRHGASGERGAVWLSSLAMWFDCLRGLDDAGIEMTVAELERRSRMSTNLDGMRRWGYVTVDGVGRVKRGGPKPRPRPGSMLAMTRRGRTAAGIWRALPGEIELRWRERFGARTRLGACVTRSWRSRHRSACRCRISCRSDPRGGSGCRGRPHASGRPRGPVALGTSGIAWAMGSPVALQERSWRWCRCCRGCCWRSRSTTRTARSYRSPRSSTACGCLPTAKRGSPSVSCRR